MRASLTSVLWKRCLASCVLVAGEVSSRTLRSDVVMLLDVAPIDNLQRLRSELFQMSKVLTLANQRDLLPSMC